MGNSNPPVSSVVLAMVSDTWSDSVRRGFYSTADQMALSLIKDCRVARLMVADHPRGVLSQLKRRVGGDGPAPTTAVLGGVRPVTIKTSLPETTSAVRRRYSLYDKQIHVALGLGHPPTSLVTFNIWHAAYGDHSRYRNVAFYSQDDERSIPRLAHLSDRISMAYRRIEERGIKTFAVSSELAARIAPAGNVDVVSNGVDADMWTNVGPVSAGTSNGARVAAYAGTIDSRIDVGAVRSLSSSGFRVRMAGPVADPSVGSELSSIPGVELVGNLSRDVVAQFLRSADVCFMAHRRTPLTEAMSPLKLYEYVCSGVPTVATDLMSVRTDPDLSARCIMVGSNEDFGSAAVDAIESGTLPPDARMDLLQRLSWESRHEAVVDFLLGDPR